MSGWRKSALSSTVNFESSARTSPSGVTMSGLISHSIASVPTNASYSFETIAAICFCSPGSRHAAVVHEPPRVPRMAALERIDVEPDERIRARRRDLLDVHAALRREHEQRLLRAAVEREREVVLACDVGCPLDPHLRDDVAADVHAQDLAGARLGLVGVARELDPARLPASARQHLRLHDHGKAELLGRLPSLLRGRREPPFGHRYPEAPEELLPLVLVEVQSARESTASTRVGRSGACASIRAA